MVKNKEETSDKKYTLKELIEELRKSYKYIRLIELKAKTYFLSFPFPQPLDCFLLVSNDLEEYEDTEIEIDKIKVLIQKAEVEFIYLPIPENLTIFELKIKNNLEISKFQQIQDQVFYEMYEEYKDEKASSEGNLKNMKSENEINNLKKEKILCVK